LASVGVAEMIAAHSARFVRFCVNDLSILILSNGNIVSWLSDE